MARKISNIKLGVFIFAGVALLIMAIFLIGDKDALFSSRFTLYAHFGDIQGLRKGATVRLSGIDVGSVSNVEFVGDTAGQVIVTMDLLDDIKKFIRKDTRASIETEGLVGNKVVILIIGSSKADPIEDGGTIQSKEPIGFAQIIEETQGIMEYTKEMTRELSEIVARVNRGEGTIGKILVDEELYNQATQLTNRADKSLQAITAEVNRVTTLFTKLSSGVESVVSNVDSVILDINYILTDVRQGKGVMGSLLTEGSSYDSLFSAMVINIQKTTEDAKIAAARLAENMEALKHNWLFKSYFEERGYWETTQYENEIDGKIQDLSNKIKMLDEKIEVLKSMEKTSDGINIEK